MLFSVRRQTADLCCYEFSVVYRTSSIYVGDHAVRWILVCLSDTLAMH